MKIALVHCPFGHREFSENLKVVDEEFCLAPPLVLAYVAAILEKAGHQVIIIDANALRLSREQALEALRRFCPELIGFRADTYWFHRVVEWATYFKKNLEVPVVVGGINLALYPGESLSYRCFDYGIAGEANFSLPELLLALQNGSSLEQISGLVYRKGGEVIVNPVTRAPVPFDDYPFPARHLLPNDRYYSFLSQRRNFSIIVTSTGCPFKCTFCAISPLPYRERSPENVLAELEECCSRYSVREVDFFDATFFFNRDRCFRIMEGIRERRLDLEWSCRSRVDLVDEGLLKEAYAAGCRKIYYGIESYSPQVLGNVKKGVSCEQVQDAIAVTRKCGIKSLGFFMVGNPGDTRESILASMEFARQLKLDFVQVCRSIPKPGTELARQLTEKRSVDYWREYVLGKRTEAPLPAPWSELSEEEARDYVRKFYAGFYFRPSYLLKRLSGVRSFSELLRYGKVAARWVCSRK